MRTKQQLQEEISLRDCIDKERDKSDKMYAIKLIEHIVFTACGVLLLGILGAWLAFVIKK